MIYFSPKGTFANRVGQKNRAGNPSRTNIDMVNRITWKWNEKHKKIARSLLSRVNKRFCRLISFRLIMHLRTCVLSVWSIVENVIESWLFHARCLEIFVLLMYNLYGNFWVFSVGLENSRQKFMAFFWKWI